MAVTPPNPDDPNAPPPPMTFHDVLRFLVRRVGGHDDGQTSDLLLMIDADEQGVKDLDTYKAELAKKRAAAAEAAQSPAQRAAAAEAKVGGLTDAELEAELTRRQAIAQAQAQARPAEAPPAAPIPTQ